jgi:hypothetical protein
MYAKAKSVMLNHNGAGSIETAIAPPTKNTIPVANAHRFLWDLANSDANNAATKVPNAWAKNGIRKCLGSNK